MQYYLIDIGIVGEHLVLQAEDVELGTCWVGWFDKKAVKGVLSIPSDRNYRYIDSNELLLSRKGGFKT
jgi:nitroreductase